MELYYESNFGSKRNLPPIPNSCDEFFDLVMKMINFTIHDKKIRLTRKLLLTEQFHDERVKKLATKHFTEDTKELFKYLFEKMMENDLIIEDNPDILAFIFTSPISLLIHYCDREPEMEPVIIKHIEDFVKYFIKKYCKT